MKQITIPQVTSFLMFVALVLTSLLLFAPLASADDHRGSRDDDETSVSNSNRATVTNTVEVEAETGDNDAEGGDGDDGGSGGDARGQNATGGDAGNGGRGGDGGTITTGTALAIGTVHNDVNSNRTYVEGCGCDDDFFPFPLMRGGYDNDDEDPISVRNSNSARVTNNLEVEAKTGDNDVEGGRGDDGGDGGDASNSHRNHFMRMMFPFFMGDTAAGDGGNGGAGGSGGTVRTGTATADGLITNVINRNVTRVEAGDDDDDIVILP